MKKIEAGTFKPGTVIKRFGWVGLVRHVFTEVGGNRQILLVDWPKNAVAGQGEDVIFVTPDDMPEIGTYPELLAHASAYSGMALARIQRLFKDKANNEPTIQSHPESAG